MDTETTSPISDALRYAYTTSTGLVAQGASNFKNNLHHSFADVPVGNWIKVIVAVVFYISIRPYIERLFKRMQERDWRKAEEKKAKEEKEYRAARMGTDGAKKARVSANQLRSGGKVLGEVGDSEEEDDAEGENEDVPEEEDEGKASGVPEWGRLARKRQKKYLKSLERQNGKTAEDLTDDQLLELLDWSEDEEEGEKKGR